MGDRFTRRQAFAAVGGAALLVGLDACAPAPDGGASPTPAAPLAVPVGKVPLGSAVIVHVDTIYPVVVAQPTEGVFTAHSAVCTHQGCVVAVFGAELDCPCHGSRFDASSGAVLGSPATQPLPEWPFTRDGDSIVLQGKDV